jgi:hypothetical protein
MSRTAVAVTDSAKAGTTMPTEASVDVANGNSVPNSDGKTLLLLHNTNGASTTRNLTVSLVSGIDGQAVTPRSIAVAAGVTKLVGPFEIVNYGTTLNVNGDNAELKILAIRAGQV